MLISFQMYTTSLCLSTTQIIQQIYIYNILRMRQMAGVLSEITPKDFIQTASEIRTDRSDHAGD